MRQKFIKTAFLMAISSLLLTMLACAPTGQVTRVEESQSQLESRLRQVETDLANLKKQNYAALAARLDQLQIQLSQLNGKIEKDEYLHARMDKRLYEVERYTSEQSARINTMITDIMALAKRAGITPSVAKIPAAPQTPAVSPAVPREGNIAKTETSPVPAIETSRTVIKKEIPKTSISYPLTPQKEYKAAFKLFTQKRYDQARKAFETFLQKHPEHKLANNAQFWIGECFYQEKKYQDAIGAYQQVLENYPNGNKVKDAMLKQAMAFAATGDTTAARILFSRVIKKFPDSNQALIAKKKLESLAINSKTE